MLTGFYCYHGLVREKTDARLERNFHLLSDFRDQVQFLKRQPETAVITFDDGYANNLAAAEILSASKMSWTLFVSTGAVGIGGMIWTVELSLLMLHGICARLEALGQTWPLGTREGREGAFQSIRCRMKAISARERRETMDEIRGQFPASEALRLLEKFPAFRMLTWEELGQLAAAGVEIGSHGVDHEIHHAAQEAGVRRQELVESKKEIERRIGKPCRSFAFPNGGICQDSPREVSEAGYEMAFTTQQEFARADGNRFMLPRVSPVGSVAKLKHQLRELRRQQWT